MKSAQPSGKPGSYEDRRETHVFLVTSLVPTSGARRVRGVFEGAPLLRCTRGEGSKRRVRDESNARRSSVRARTSREKKTRRRDDAARARTNAAQPLDRGPSPHVSCQAKARVPICAQKDRFTRVFAASFTGAPRYTREGFILGSGSSLLVAAVAAVENQKNTQTPRFAAPRRRRARVARWKKKSFCGWVCAQAQPTNKQPRVVSSQRRAPRASECSVVPNREKKKSPRRFQATPHRNEDSKSPFPDGPV